MPHPLHSPIPVRSNFHMPKHLMELSPGPGDREGHRARAGLRADRRASRGEVGPRGGARADRRRAPGGRGRGADRAAGAGPGPGQGAQGCSARGPAPGIRGLRPPGRLRQARPQGRGLSDGLRGRGRCLRERESPPEGGPERGGDGHSGGPIRFSLPPTDRRAGTPGGLTVLPARRRRRQSSIWFAAWPATPTARRCATWSALRSSVSSPCAVWVHGSMFSFGKRGPDVFEAAQNRARGPC
jgi:hypothetical protein